MTVNGTARDAGERAADAAADVLREELGVTSPKAGCQDGRLRRLHRDRRRRAPPLLPAADRRPRGARSLTVEGSARRLDLAPIQQAFTHHYAAQCGFCTGA